MLYRDQKQQAHWLESLKYSIDNVLQSTYKECIGDGKNQIRNKNCQRDLNNYRQYLNQYKKQFVEVENNINQKGEEMCIKKVGEGSFEERSKRRNQCAVFYMKSFSVFEENVKDKLNSLVNKFDYAEL